MSTIALPKSLDIAFRKSVNTEDASNNLTRHLKNEDVHPILIEHRRTMASTPTDEYRITLQMILSFYAPGEAANVNDLAKSASKMLDAEITDRTVSQTQIRESFIPLLRQTGIIEGEGRLVWAYLDTPSALQIFKQRTSNMYTAFLAQTEHEAKLKHMLRDATALRKLEAVVLDSRVLQEDIGNQLEFLKREDRKHRELAHELGLPYSQIKADAKKQRKGAQLNLSSFAFPLAIGAVVVFGFLMAPNTDEVTPTEEAFTGASHYSEVISPASQYGLSADEYTWRQRYVELYTANNGSGSKEMEDEMFNLAAQFMINRSRMEAIVKTITPAEVSQ